MSILPEYSPAAPAPSYSRYSDPSETTLGSGMPHQPSRIGTFTHKSTIGILSLSRQEEGCAHPAYGPHSPRIIGELALTGREHIISVIMRVRIATALLIALVDIVQGHRDHGHL
jgi:hypothetical protein